MTARTATQAQKGTTIALAVDLIAHRTAHVVSVREAAVWSSLWIALGVALGGVVWWSFGSQAGGEYFAGYLIENFAWVLYLFGAFLVFTGWKMFRHRDDQLDPSRNPVLRWARKRLPSTDVYHGQKFWVRQAGRRVVTPLFFVLVMVETTDIIFAVDSIPAIFAVTGEPFLIFTSNAFAILGLRAMYFLLADLIHRFVHLKAGLAAILVFVGVKMLLLDVYKIPIWISLAVIAASLAVAVVLSLRATGRQPDDVAAES